MKKIIIFTIIMVLVSFQAFCAGSSEGISAQDGRNTKTEKVSKTSNGEKDVFIVSQIIDKEMDLTLEILSYKENRIFFPEGVNFENKNQDNPLVEVKTLFPEIKDYLEASIFRIQNEGGVLKITRNIDKEDLENMNTIYIFSKEETLMIVSLERSIVLKVEQEEILEIISGWVESW